MTQENTPEPAEDEVPASDVEVPDKHSTEDGSPSEGHENGEFAEEIAEEAPPTRPSRFGRALFAGLGTLVCASIAVSTAFLTQGWMTVDEDHQAIVAQYGETKSALSEEDRAALDSPEGRDFVTNYFPKMTQPDKSGVVDLNAQYEMTYEGDMWHSLAMSINPNGRDISSMLTRAMKISEQDSIDQAIAYAYGYADTICDSGEAYLKDKSDTTVMGLDEAIPNESDFDVAISFCSDEVQALKAKIKDTPGTTQQATATTEESK